MKNNQQGRSMIEMLGVLSIIGVLSVSGIALYSKALHQRKINTTIEQISQIISNMRNAYRNRNEYSFTMPTSKANDKRKIIPDNMWVNNQIYTALRQEVQYIGNCEIESMCDKTKEFLIIVYNSETDRDAVNACVKILTADWGNNVKVCGDYENNNSCNCNKANGCSSVYPVDTAMKYCSEGLKIGFYVK